MRTGGHTKQDLTEFAFPIYGYHPNFFIDRLIVDDLMTLNFRGTSLGRAVGA